MVVCLVNEEESKSINVKLGDILRFHRKFDKVIFHKDNCDVIVYYNVGMPLRGFVRIDMKVEVFKSSVI